MRFLESKDTGQTVDQRRVTWFLQVTKIRRSFATLLLGFVLVIGMMSCTSTSSHGEPITLTCQEEQIGQDGQSAGKAEYTVVIERGSSATLTLGGPYGNVRLPAMVEEKENQLGARASGPAKMRMPLKSDIDACLAQKRSTNPQAFEGDEMNAFLVRGCQLSAGITPEPVPVTLSVTVTIIEKPDAQVFTQRRYAGDDEKAAQLYGVDSFPMPQCKVQGGK